MSNRITTNDLDHLVNTINELAVITVSLDYAYNGVKLVNVRSNSDVLNTGFVSKRELYNRMRALCTGLGLQRIGD